MENRKHWTESFRVVTPLLITVAIALLSILLSSVNSIDEKLFKHLTNDEIHCARSIMVSKSEFNIYQSMRDRQMFDLKDGISEIKLLLREHMKEQPK